MTDASITELVETVNRDLLPESLQDLADVIGLENTIKLIDRFPGISLYIPHKTTDSHVLVTVIGEASAEALCDAFGGNEVRLPKLDSAKRQFKYHTLRKMKSAGCSNRIVAQVLQYSERHVERLASQFRNEHQLDLFEDM